MMTPVNLSLEIKEEHPAYQWAKRQSDSVSAMGHIGTHIDCYTRVPDCHEYCVDTVILDCSDKMPDMETVLSLDLEQKALVLYTANLERNGYGNDLYGKTSTVLDSGVLDTILEKRPAFIVIDSYGIGTHGDQHLEFDKRCEEHGCFVIENVTLTGEVVRRLLSLEIAIDKNQKSSGKRCELIGQLADQ